MKIRIWYGQARFESDIIVPSDKESELLFDHITRDGHGLPVTPGSFMYLKKMAKLHGEELDITEPRGTKRDSSIDYSKIIIQEEPQPFKTEREKKRISILAFEAAFADKFEEDPKLKERFELLYGKNKRSSGTSSNKRY